MGQQVTHEHKVGDVFYRIDDRLRSYVVDCETESYGSVLTLEGSEYKVVKVTPKGVWLDIHMDKPRFVCLTTVKQFAHPTKEQAVKSFQARKNRQAKIYRARLERAERAAAKATTFQWPDHKFDCF